MAGTRVCKKLAWKWTAAAEREAQERRDEPEENQRAATPPTQDEFPTIT